MDDKLKDRARQLTQRAKEKLAAGGVELTDEQLDNVAGGALEDIPGLNRITTFCPWCESVHEVYQYPQDFVLPNGAPTDYSLCMNFGVGFYRDKTTGEFFDDDYETIPIY